MHSNVRHAQAVHRTTHLQRGKWHEYRLRLTIFPFFSLIFVSIHRNASLPHYLCWHKHVSLSSSTSCFQFIPTSLIIQVFILSIFKSFLESSWQTYKLPNMWWLKHPWSARHQTRWRRQNRWRVRPVWPFCPCLAFSVSVTVSAADKQHLMLEPDSEVCRAWALSEFMT